MDLIRIVQERIDEIKFAKDRYKPHLVSTNQLFLQRRRTPYGIEEDILTQMDQRFPNKSLNDVFCGILFYQYSKKSAIEVGLVFRENNYYILLEPRLENMEPEFREKIFKQLN